MGMIGNWLEKRRVDKFIRNIKGAMRSQYGAKASAELAREGGWDVWSWLKSDWKTSGSIWKNYSTRDLEITYAVASAIHACVRLKCVTANQAYMEVGQWTKKGWQALDDHNFYDLMRRPNGGQDTVAFTWDVIAHAELTGWSYIWKLRNKGGQVIAMQPVPTSWVTRVYDERSGTLRAYSLHRSTNDQEILIKLEDMFYIQYPNPEDPTQAAGPLGAALKDLQIDDARSNLLVEMLTNIHFPGTILKNEDDWTPNAKKEAREMLQDLIGAGKRARPLFTNKNVEIELPKPPTDMDWPGTAAQAETRICAAFGVPPILCHFRAGLDRSTYSNYGEARRSFYNDTMRAVWALFASAFERGMLIDEGEDLEIEPDFDGIAEMQEDKDEQHERVRKDFAGGLLFWDEAREKIGEDALPGKMGKVFLLPMNVQVVEISKDPGGTPQQLANTEVDNHLDNADIEEDDIEEEEIDEEENEEADDDTEDVVGKSQIIVVSN